MKSNTSKLNNQTGGRAMREIKFRAWDKTARTFYFVSLSDNGWSHQDTDLEGHELSEWQQYTGLKDKNGVEIYEGDIIKLKETVLSDTEEPDYPYIETKRDNMFVYANGETGRRIWGHELINVDDRFGTHSDDWTDYYGYESPTEIQGGEVIGNIWEESEL